MNRHSVSAALIVKGLFAAAAVALLSGCAHDDHFAATDLRNIGTPITVAQATAADVYKTGASAEDPRVKSIQDNLTTAQKAVAVDQSSINTETKKANDMGAAYDKDQAKLAGLPRLLFIVIVGSLLVGISAYFATKAAIAGLSLAGPWAFLGWIAKFLPLPNAAEVVAVVLYAGLVWLLAKIGIL